MLPKVTISPLIILRITPPYIIKNCVNKILADILGYFGQVEHIDFKLIGAIYTTKRMYLNKVIGKSKIPLLDFKEIPISAEWKSLIHAKIIMTELT
ncbi:hypothetical protein [Maribacter sp. ACAM166]|uniref:hypothetical protein n=1 Tax=Maribacter sp. ACAM166 TaxID=2508996 RepID=UPI0010FD8411|nr:hypothetical protein [Maribacter sp. ACAM166]TLP81411.1 hypothetical protein ES765_05235 [Maribacter sp. ACAM166]